LNEGLGMAYEDFLKNTQTHGGILND